jgi:cobalt-zinc-cadmium resistance protein CzcA
MLFIFPLAGYGQQQPAELTLDDAIKIALENNKGLQAASERVNKSKQLIGTGWDIDKTEVYYNFDQNNIAPNNLPLNVWGVSQSMQFPTIYGAKRKLLKSEANLQERAFVIESRLLTKEVSVAYYNVLYWQLVSRNYAALDSLYAQFSRTAERRFSQGESNYLEKLTAETKHREVSVKLKQSQESEEKAHIILNQWLQTDSVYVISLSDFTPLPLTALDTATHPGLSYYQQAEKLSVQALALEKNQLLPDLNFSVFQGTNNGIGQTQYTGFQAGVAIPLWFGANKSKISASKTEVLIMQKEAQNYRNVLKAKYLGLVSDLKLHQQELDYYNSIGSSLSKELVFHAQNAFKEGEIDFLQFALFIENAKNIEITHLEAVLKYNLTILEANYITN